MLILLGWLFLPVYLSSGVSIIATPDYKGNNVECGRISTRTLFL